MLIEFSKEMVQIHFIPNHLCTEDHAFIQGDWISITISVTLDFTLKVFIVVRN